MPKFEINHPGLGRLEWEIEDEAVPISVNSDDEEFTKQVMETFFKPFSGIFEQCFMIVFAIMSLPPNQMMEQGMRFHLFLDKFLKGVAWKIGNTGEKEGGVKENNNTIEEVEEGGVELRFICNPRQKYEI